MQMLWMKGTPGDDFYCIPSEDLALRLPSAGHTPPVLLLVTHSSPQGPTGGRPPPGPAGAAPPSLSCLFGRLHTSGGGCQVPSFFWENTPQLPPLPQLAGGHPSGPAVRHGSASSEQRSEAPEQHVLWGASGQSLSPHSATTQLEGPKQIASEPCLRHGHNRAAAEINEVILETEPQAWRGWNSERTPSCQPSISLHQPQPAEGGDHRAVAWSPGAGHPWRRRALFLSTMQGAETSEQRAQKPGA